MRCSSADPSRPWQHREPSHAQRQRHSLSLVDVEDYAPNNTASIVIIIIIIIIIISII
jgi:hypothetical protein